MELVEYKGIFVCDIVTREMVRGALYIGKIGRVEQVGESLKPKGEVRHYSSPFGETTNEESTRERNSKK